MDSIYLHPIPLDACKEEYTKNPIYIDFLAQKCLKRSSIYDTLLVKYDINLHSDYGFYSGLAFLNWAINNNLLEKSMDELVILWKLAHQKKAK